MDPLTIIALTVAIAVGVPMVSYLGYRAHKRLEWNKTHDPWYTTTTTTKPTTTTTSPAPTTVPPTKHRRRQKHRRVGARHAAIPVMLVVITAAHPVVEHWDRLTTMPQNCRWGLIVLPVLAASYLIVTVIMGPLTT